MYVSQIEFLVDENINTRLNELIPRAMYHIVICNPWLDPEHHILDKIILALKNKVKVEVITLPPKKEKYKQAIDKITKSGGEVYLKENLHAKIFFFDHRDLIVGSSNLKATSLVRNKEAALYTTDEAAIKSAKAYFDTLILSSEKIIMEEKHTIEENEIESEITGFCIECGKVLDYNKKKPVCIECYSKTPYFFKWRKFCHECGKEEKTTIPKPLCGECFSKK